MAYFEQKILSATAGGSSAATPPTNIPIMNGTVADEYINRAVTFDGEETASDMGSPKVRLADAGEVVIGAILGTSYGRLQIAVEGWDVKFKVGAAAVTKDSRIIGAVSADATPKAGYIGNPARTTISPSGATATNAELEAHVAVLEGQIVEFSNGRGSVLKAAPAGGTATVSIKLGG